MFTPNELESLFCGETDIDVDLLQRVTEYEGGVGPSDPHIQVRNAEYEQTLSRTCLHRPAGVLGGDAIIYKRGAVCADQFLQWANSSAFRCRRLLNEL
jgi:hypothetical protein